eukprot:12394415-Karenia_brevis.AAC.1
MNATVNSPQNVAVVFIRTALVQWRHLVSFKPHCPSRSALSNMGVLRKISWCSSTFVKGWYYVLSSSAM